MVEITFENVSKYFKKVKAVDKFNLKIRDKEFMVLLGPSGCGKTTTLRMTAGLEKLTNGNIYFDDELVNDLEPKTRRVAMVFQDYALYPHMSVFDNITLCLRVMKVPKKEIKIRAKETAELLQIEELLDRKSWALSGGQKQRVALARAIIREPSIYLLDEPLSNLDAMLRTRMRGELKKLHEKLRTTTVYVTHDQTEAMVMADRIAIMKDGTLHQVGKPREIYDHPKNKFVATFVGMPAINFIEGQLTKKDGELLLNTDVFSLKIPDALLEARVQEKFLNSEVILGVRSEYVYVHTKQLKGAIEAKVWLFQQMGDVGYVDLEIGTYMITAKVDPLFDVEEGKKVFVKFDERFLQVFDKSSEERIS
ncbi:ABC transporter ATP-binding protein [Candidatus Bathyarchaeota archaeon]|nr:ABC transporter ATP-binding protein [Candidatus Bathyarchaeota archaeon]